MMEVKQAPASILDFKDIVQPKLNGVVTPNELDDNEVEMDKLCFSDNEDEVPKFSSGKLSDAGNLVDCLEKTKVVKQTNDLLNVLKEGPTSRVSGEVEEDENGSVLANDEIDMIAEEFLNEIGEEEDRTQDEEVMGDKIAEELSKINGESEDSKEKVDEENKTKSAEVQKFSTKEDIKLRNEGKDECKGVGSPSQDKIDSNLEQTPEKPVEVENLLDNKEVVPDNTADAQQEDTVEERSDSVSTDSSKHIESKDTCGVNADENAEVSVSESGLMEDKTKENASGSENVVLDSKEASSQSENSHELNTNEKLDVRRKSTSIDKEISERSSPAETSNKDQKDENEVKDQVECAKNNSHCLDALCTNTDKEVDLNKSKLDSVNENNDVITIEDDRMDETSSQAEEKPNDTALSKSSADTDSSVHLNETSLGKSVKRKASDFDIINLDSPVDFEEERAKTSSPNVEIKKIRIESDEKEDSNIDGCRKRNSDGFQSEDDDVMVLDSTFDDSAVGYSKKVPEKVSNETVENKKTLEPSVGYEDDDDDDVMLVECKESKSGAETKENKENMDSKGGKLEKELTNEGKLECSKNFEQKEKVDDLSDDDVVLLDDEKEEKLQENSNKEQPDTLKEKDAKSSEKKPDEALVEEEIFSFNTSMTEGRKSEAKTSDDDDDDVVLLEESHFEQSADKSDEKTDDKEQKASVDKGKLNKSSSLDKDSEQKIEEDKGETNKLESDVSKQGISKEEKTNEDNDDIVFVDNQSEKEISDRLEKSNSGKIKDDNDNNENKNEDNKELEIENTEQRNEAEGPLDENEIVDIDEEKESNKAEENTEDKTEAQNKASEVLVSDNSDNAQDKFPEKPSSSGAKTPEDNNSCNDDDNLLREVEPPQNSRSNEENFKDGNKDSETEASETEGPIEPLVKRAKVSSIDGDELSATDSFENEKKTNLDKNSEELNETVHYKAKEKCLKRTLSPDASSIECKKTKIFTDDEVEKCRNKIKSENCKPELNGLKEEDNEMLEPLDPPPKTIKKVDFNLDFLRRFKKSISKMSKSDLEELVLQKIVEVIVHKSEFSEMRDLIEKQEKIIATHRTKIAEVTKQFRDLEMVHYRVLKDLETKNQQFIMPVKITRAVGLQVLIPKRIDPNASKMSGGDKPNSSNSAATPSNNSVDIKRKCPQKATPLRPDITQQQTAGVRAASSTVQTVAQSVATSMNTTPPQSQSKVQQKIITRNTALLPATPSQSAVVAINQQTTPPQYVVQQTSLMGSSPHTNAVASQTPRKPAAPVRPQPSVNLVFYSQRPPAPQSSPDRPRVPPMILKKSGTNGRVLTVANPTSITSTTTSTSQPNASAINNKSVIDLTDEDDATTKMPPNNTTTLPALVAIPAQTQATRVTYVVNKPNSAPQRVTVTQSSSALQRLPVGKGGTQFVAIAPKPSVPALTTANPPRLPAATVVRRSHPAPLPKAPPALSNPGWKAPPPRPSIRINNVDSGIVISWTMEEMNDQHADITSYQIYAYQETSAPPQVEAWRHVGDVKAMLLPMAVTLTQFQEGQRYYFAVRAVDMHSRCGPFSMPKTWA